MAEVAVALDLERIAEALGSVPRVSYEATHVYPFTVPDFAACAGTARPQPSEGPLRVYVHVPYCNYACTFCTYTKRVNGGREQMRRYVDAVKSELGFIAPGRLLRQLYLGGGTPTALPADLLDEVLSAVLGRAALQERAPVTVESSPESLSMDHVHVCKARGVNRISMGVQSLDDGILRVLNRRHSARQALEMCARLVAAGLFVNVDLIYGLPQQTTDHLRADLTALSACGPHSITVYNLRLNERTPVRTRLSNAERLDLARLVRWRTLLHDTTAELGYAQTRWHTFVRRDAPAWWYDRAPGTNAFGPGREVGIGVSAISHLGDVMYRNHADVERYQRSVEAGQSPVSGTFTLGERERQTVFIARTLGDGRSLNRADYERAFGRTIDDDFSDVLSRLEAAELIQNEGNCLALTAIGRLVYDLVTLAFYPPRARQWLDEREARLAV